MTSNPIKPVNLSGIASFITDLKISWRAFVVMLKAENRAARRAKGLTRGDAFFNFIKLSFLKFTVLRYRYIVRFGDQVLLDSTFPPFPSRAFDKRMLNYINNLDLTELPTGIVSISTTNACPYACAFCSTNVLRDTDTDLDEELLKQTISKVEALGVPSIILHGGEPLYRYDRFLRLVKHVSNEICLWMFTTGYGATREKAQELKENGLFGVWVSLDHFKPEVHNRHERQSPGFRECL